MAMTSRDRVVYRADDLQDHLLLSDNDRRKLVEPYLPEVPSDQDAWEESPQKVKKSHFGVRRFLRNQLHVLVYTIMHTIFSLYMRIRQAWHLLAYRTISIFSHHHRTPEIIQGDVKKLRKLPKHLSVILTQAEGGRRGGDLERLINETADLAVWCACAGIPTLSVYERTGILKRYMPQIRRVVVQKFTDYFGSQRPGLKVTAPHTEEPIVLHPDPGYVGDSLTLLLISYQDGRESMVDLTRTLAEMSQRGKLSPADINLELIDTELSDLIMDDPNLLVLFGPHTELAGYPPWHIRLSEIFCLKDNQGVDYPVFMRALRSYAGAEMRLGK